MAQSPESRAKAALNNPRRVGVSVIDTHVVPNLETLFPSVNSAAKFIKCSRTLIYSYLLNNRTELLKAR